MMATDTAAATDLIPATNLYYSCIGYVVNFSTSYNESVDITTDDIGVKTSSSLGEHESLNDTEVDCELWFQSLYRPFHDPRRYARELLTYLLMGVAGSTVGCFGLIGNLLSLIVLTRRNMRTSTYCYLAALAICDLLAVFFMLILLIKDTRRPEPARPTWPTDDDAGFYPYLFPYLNPAAFTLQVSSVWLTLAFTVDRYIMICHPFRSEPFCTVRRARLVVISLIAASIAFNLPKFFEYQTVVMPTMSAPPGSAVSNYTVVYTDLTVFGKSRRFKVLYHSWLYIVFVFALPFTALLVLNGFLVQAVRVSRLRTQELGRLTRKAVTHIEQVSTTRQPTAAGVAQPSSSLLNFVAQSPKASVEAPISAGVSPSRHPTSLSLSDRRVLPNVPSSPVSKRIDTTVMLIGVVIIFIVCQFPALVSRTLWAFEEEPSTAFTKLPMYALNEVANFLVLLNSSVNIIPYYFFGRRFRRQFLELFCPRCSTKNVSGTGGRGITDGQQVLGVRLPVLRRRKRDMGADSSIGYNRTLTEVGAVPCHVPSHAQRKTTNFNT